MKTSETFWPRKFGGGSRQVIGAVVATLVARALKKRLKSLLQRYTTYFNTNIGNSIFPQENRSDCYRSDFDSV
jgi:hypothetical protein